MALPEIPDPCHFESCPEPDKPCGNCGDNSSRKFFTNKTAKHGVPTERFITPIVRVNGWPQDMQPGQFIPNCWVEPPDVSYNPESGVLNIGGRFVQIGDPEMNLKDCHGNAIGSCQAVMSCVNFREIILASPGIRFVDPNNPFAGLVPRIDPQSANYLTVTANGLALNMSAICNYVAANCGSGGNSPTPTPTPDGTTTKTIYAYSCVNSGGSSLGTAAGTLVATRNDTTGVVTVSNSSYSYLYSGTQGTASYLGAAGAVMTLANFNNLTMAAIPTTCSSSPNPNPNPDPNPPVVSSYVNISPSSGNVTGTQGTAITPVTFTWTGYGTCQGTPTVEYYSNNALPAGLTATVSGGPDTGTITISGTPTASGSGTGTYRIIVGGCAQPFTVNFTIAASGTPDPNPNPNPTPDPTPPGTSQKTVTGSWCRFGNGDIASSNLEDVVLTWTETGSGTGVGTVSATPANAAFSSTAYTYLLTGTDGGNRSVVGNVSSTTMSLATFNTINAVASTGDCSA